MTFFMWVETWAIRCRWSYTYLSIPKCIAWIVCWTVCMYNVFLSNYPCFWSLRMIVPATKNLLKLMCFITTQLRKVEMGQEIHIRKGYVMMKGPEMLTAHHELTQNLWQHETFSVRSFKSISCCIMNVF